MSRRRKPEEPEPKTELDFWRADLERSGEMTWLQAQIGPAVVRRILQECPEIDSVDSLLAEMDSRVRRLEMEWRALQG